MRKAVAKTAGALLLCAAVLAACAQDTPSSGPAAAQQARWVGFFESSLGLLGCPARGPMAVEIENGQIAGDAQADGFVMGITGKVGPNGAVVDGVFRRDQRAAAIMTGTFLESEAAGRWQGAACEGVWSLRRVAP